MKVYVVCKKFDDELSQFGDPIETLSDLTKAKNKAEQIIIEEKNKRKSRKGYLNAVSNTYPIVNETYLKEYWKQHSPTVWSISSEELCWIISIKEFDVV